MIPLGVLPDPEPAGFATVAHVLLGLSRNQTAQDPKHDAAWKP